MSAVLKIVFQGKFSGDYGNILRVFCCKFVGSCGRVVERCGQIVGDWGQTVGCCGQFVVSFKQAIGSRGQFMESFSRFVGHCMQFVESFGHAVGGCGRVMGWCSQNVGSYGPFVGLCWQSMERWGKLCEAEVNLWGVADNLWDDPVELNNHSQWKNTNGTSLLLYSYICAFRRGVNMRDSLIPWWKKSSWKFVDLFCGDGGLLKVLRNWILYKK